MHATNPHSRVASRGHTTALSPPPPDGGAGESAATDALPKEQATPPAGFNSCLKELGMQLVQVRSWGAQGRTGGQCTRVGHMRDHRGNYIHCNGSWRSWSSRGAHP